MTHVWSTFLHSLGIPTVILLGVAATGCATEVSNSGGGGSGASGASGGNGGDGGEGGGGGSTCKPSTEICDGLDNDCNGQVDDVAGGCACNDGATQACYTGPEGTAGVGTCKDGTQSCQGGQWGACTGEVVPAAEACNTLDDDCNGTADDMGLATCGVGACANAVEKCVNGQMQTCVPGQPGVEVCDGIDNNCNQLTDESDPMLNAACESGLPGVCAVGKMACTAQALVCVPDVMPSMETCDGLDNDCNGLTDDGIPGTGGTCATGAPGVCAPGTITCKQSAGAWQIDCFSDVEASPEVCDGLDNTCNGATDEGNPGGGGACDTGQPGVCQAGTLNCVGGSVQCTPNAQASVEVCNGMDDNCDGQADEGNPGGGQACGCGGSGVTSCQNGQVVCNGGPITYFSETFANNNAGWTLGPNWQIGPAVGGCSGCTGNPDPAQDHTPTADNGLAGVVIGGPAPTGSLHDFYYLTSPAFNTANAAGSVYLSFWRWLNSDYLSYMQNTVEVWNGSQWVVLPYGQTGGCCGVMDTQWTNQPVPPGAPLQATTSAEYPTQFDLTPYKNAQMRIRFGYRIGSSGVYTIGSWSIDDVVVASAICP